MPWALLVLAFLQATAPATMRVLDRSTQSGIDEPQQVVVRDAAAWAALWRRHAPNRPQPQLDFAREMVVAVFSGSRPTAGYSVEIVGASERAGVLIVRYRETGPREDAITAQVLTAPAYIVALPRHDGEVRFERSS